MDRLLEGLGQIREDTGSLLNNLEGTKQVQKLPFAIESGGNSTSELMHKLNMKHRPTSLMNSFMLGIGSMFTME